MISRSYKFKRSWLEGERVLKTFISIKAIPECAAIRMDTNRPETEAP
jgi:hypothetical protein